MTIDKARLQRIADKKIANEKLIALCKNCNNSASFRWNFQTNTSTKTCIECGHVDLVIGKDEKVVV